ncbi:hypothetical protein CLV32_2528 [Pedobacter duraquae]|uniref:DUF5672 domain-containing protein n=2 Tax=Pedobacter duraquae TaxID=425511 RepID=A0A4R6IGD7_9SPHI|nr:hypothetical protein CLV32_2528 [Pedobacter duraquae]
MTDPGTLYAHKINTMKKNCAVVIPVYKTELSELEAIAVEQCKRILSADFDVIVIKPENLDLEKIPLLSFATSSISFADSYFQNVQQYNNLMLSADFYGKFLDYEYMLIYQLDAFVFQNTLAFWCKQNFDYIGAPWIREKPFPTYFKTLKEAIRSSWHRRFNPIGKDGVPDAGRQLNWMVGNGGLSLRKVDIFYQACLREVKLISQYIDQTHPHYNEDIFWCIEMNRRKKKIKVPNYKQAVYFSIEKAPDRAFMLTHNTLPFGCHAWDKNIEFWKPYFKQQGYIL